MTVAVVAVWVARRTTWYLAIDQFGYLTFARDLAEGRVFHQWPLLADIGSLLPEGQDADVFAQTYVRRGEALYSRYSPGYPLILALAARLFGGGAQHSVNVVALVLLLVCAYLLARRLLESEWLGLAAALLSVLLPNYVLLWSISPLRDVPAHLLAWAGLLALLGTGRRLGGALGGAAAGCLLGYAITTRVDALLYLVPAGLVAFAGGGLRRRGWLALALGLLVGGTPLLAYNWLATGNPFVPTQAMELREITASRDDARAAERLARLAAMLGVTAAIADEGPGAPLSVPTPSEAQPRTAGVEEILADEPAATPTPALVQGGGLRLSHLAATLPANLAQVREVMGDLGLALAIVGACTAGTRPMLLLAVVPYVGLSLVFFSLWVRPDPRYVLGALLMLPLLALHGAQSLVAAPQHVRGRFGYRAGALVALLASLAVGLLASREDFAAANARPWVSVVLGAALGAALLASLLPAGGSAGEQRARRVLSPTLAGLLVALLAWRSFQGLDVRASFQRPQVDLARATLARVLAPRAVVLTSDAIGRPAENINYYTSADALYLSDVLRWRVPLPAVVFRLLMRRYVVYLLLPPGEAERLTTWMSARVSSTVVASVPPEMASRFFVASPLHRGVPLSLVRLFVVPRKPAQ